MPVAPPEPPPVAAPTPVPTPSAEFDRSLVHVVELYGTADQRGRQYGENLQAEIRAALAQMFDSWSTGSDAPLAEWPCASNDALVGAALGAGVNQEAVVKLNQQCLPMSQWAIGFSASSPYLGLPMDPAKPLAVHVHHEVEQLPYLGVAEVGQVQIRVGMNSARLAVSCEPLTDEIVPADVVKLTGKLHQVLAKATSKAMALEELRELAIQGNWCLGLSMPGEAADYYCFSGGSFSAATSEQATHSQRAFHDAQPNSSQVLQFVDKRTGATLDVDLKPYLPEMRRQAEAQPAEPVAPTVMKRWVLRTTAEALPAVDPRAFCSGQAIGILGDGEFAQSLAEMVVEHGGNAAVGATFDQIAAQAGGAVPLHLVLTSCADQGERNMANPLPADIFTDQFMAVQTWMAGVQSQGALDQATLSMVTRLGGDLGFAGPVADYAGGGMTGFAKAMRREHPQLRVKLIDCQQQLSATEAATHLLDELASRSSDLEVGYFDGARHVVQTIQENAATDGGSQPTSGGVWICTGGGRGVTSVVAKELACRFGVCLHLFGTAPVPAADAKWRGLDQAQLKDLKRQVAIEAREAGLSPTSEWARIEKAIELDANLKQFDEAGLDWQYHSCDITNREELAKTLDAIRQQHGPIEGILHGAGVEAACRFSAKKADSVRLTIASKCDGASHLVELTRNDPLRYFVGFGSTSGRFGGLGQADYSLASDSAGKDGGPTFAGTSRDACLLHALASVGRRGHGHATRKPHGAGSKWRNLHASARGCQSRDQRTDRQQRGARSADPRRGRPARYRWHHVAHNRTRTKAKQQCGSDARSRC